MSSKKIQVKVVYFNKVETFMVSVYELVYALKELIKNKDQIPVENQMLVYLGLELDDTKTFGNYNIDNDSIIALQMSIALQKKHAHLLLAIEKPNSGSDSGSNAYPVGYYDNIPLNSYPSSTTRSAWFDYETHQG